MAWRAEINTLTAECDGGLQILHPPQQLKATQQQCRNAAQVILITLKFKSNIMSLECNYQIQEIVNVTVICVFV